MVWREHLFQLNEQGYSVSFRIWPRPNGPNQRRVEGGAQSGTVESKFGQEIPHILF